MKNSKKIISFVLAFILVFSIASSVMAATKVEVTMEKVKDEKVLIDLDGQGKVTKQMTEMDTVNKTVTIKIDVENSMSPESEIIPSEIYFVIDNSLSMRENTVEGVTRREAVFTAAKTLAEKILTAQPSTKIGVVRFSTFYDASAPEGSQYDKEGTIDDARLVLSATSDLNTIKTSIDGIVTDGPRTNIDAGIQVALNNITTDTSVNRYIVLLSDGVPNTAVGGPTMTYGGDVTTKTKATLKNVIDSGINIVTVMTGVSSEYKPNQSGTDNPKTYLELATDIFGTQANPNYGKYYYVTDSEAATTITEDVYSDVVKYYDNNLKDIVITDYFPQEIIDNFDYKITKSENIGHVDTVINKDTGAITWTIETLEAGKTASFEYTLYLKDEFADEIVNVEEDTNKKLEVEYKDKDSKDQKKESDESPSLILKKLDVIPAVLNLTAKKTLDGRALKAEEFSFQIKDEQGKVVATGKNDASGNIKFSTITISEEGEYKFVVSEVAGSEKGMVYDAKNYSLKIKVAKADDGKSLVVKGANLEQDGSYSYNVATFVNKYANEAPTPIPQTGDKLVLFSGLLMVLIASSGVIVYKRHNLK